MRSEILNSGLKVIRGGRTDAPSKTENKRFISAYATDTRLMGVLGVFLEWKKAISEDREESFHQFFYLDLEDCGIDSYKSLRSNDMEQIRRFIRKNSDFLGGRKILISLKEAVFLIRSAAIKNIEKNVQLPPESSEFSDLLDMDGDLTKEGYFDLMYRLCDRLNDPFKLVNYYLMRSFAGDREGASLLENEMGIELQEKIKDGEIGYYVTPGAELFTNDFGLCSPVPATLCRNDVDDTESDGRVFYVSESLVEENGSYYIVTSSVSLDDETGKVNWARCNSRFRISSAEAAMKLTHPEYIIVLDILCDMNTFEQYFSPMMVGSTENEYPSGRMYILYNSDNRHVNNRTYMIHADVFNIFFVTEGGQLIVAAYDMEAVKTAEEWLLYSRISTILCPEGKFRFNDPVLYDFVDSELDDFMEYLSYIRLDHDDN